MATQSDFRDADGRSATVVERLLENHDPDLHDAILNGDPVAEDEDGFITVRERGRDHNLLYGQAGRQCGSLLYVELGVATLPLDLGCLSWLYGCDACYTAVCV